MRTTQEDHCRTSNAFSSSSIPQFAPLTPEKATRNEKRKEQESGDGEARLAARELELSKELKMLTANLLDAIRKEDHSKDTGGNETTKLDKEDHMKDTRGNETSEVGNTNKTPQKKQRRKKHRPKVLEEGEVKTLRTTNLNHGIPKENPTTKKRKYTRRKAQNLSPTPAAETREGPDEKTTVSSDSRGKSTCKRKYVRRKHLNNASMASPEEATPGLTGTAAAMGESDKKTNVFPDSKGTTTCKRKYVRRKQLNKGLTTSPKEVSPESTDPNITGIDAFDGSPTDKSKSQQRKASRKVWFTLPEENETSSNPKMTEVSASEKNPGKKRRGRSKVSDSTTPQAGFTTRSINQNISGATRKHCRRALNFDIEGNSGNDCSRCKPVMNVDSQTRTTDIGEGSQVNSTMLLGCGVEVIARCNQNCATYGLDSYVDEMLKDYVSERNAPRTSAPAMSTPGQNNWLAQNLENHTIGMHQSDPNLQESTSQTMSQVGTLLSTRPDGSFSSIFATLTDGGQEKGSKRKHYISFGQGDSHCTNATGILYNGLLAYQNIAQLEESYEKTRAKKGWTSLFPVTYGNIGQSVVQNYSEGSISNINCHIVPPSDPTEEILVDCVIQQLEGFPNPITNMESLAVDSSSVLTPKKRRKKRDRVVQVPTTPLGNEDKLQEKGILFNQDQFLENAPSAPTDFMWKQMLSVDEIANRLKNLDLERENTEIHDSNGGALVPCTVRNLNQGELALYTDGTIVLYDGSFQHIKKRRGRPKVELDDETNRMWNLLMESNNIEGVDGTNEEREKWWEEERNIFHGRANLFIARMRLVQGERHFSRWKGSVVDSVVGVFLTQNVADHLSSSAFMSLVARFPLKSNPYQCDDMESSSCVTSSGTLHRSEQEEQEVADSDGSDCASTFSHAADRKKSLTENNSAGNLTHGSELNHPSESKEQELNDALRKAKSKRIGNEIQENFDWDSLRKQAEVTEGKRERLESTMDSLDWEAVRSTTAEELANVIRDRGMNNRLAARIQAFLNRLVRDHGSIDLEWLRDVPPDKVKDYLLSFRGLGLKSVECVRLLTLHHLAFPVDTNVGRIAVRLGWVPLRPLPESLQLHLLEMYPVMESIQKYLWPRLCKLDQRTLYELHYQMITFGKVFCTKSKPNCNACPMRGECRHFASAFTSARLALPGPEQKGMVSVTENRTSNQKPAAATDRLLLPQSHALKHLGENDLPRASSQEKAGVSNSIPIVDEPSTPEPEPEPMQALGNDIEDLFLEDPDEIPIINLNIEQFTQNLQNYMQENMELEEGDLSRALVALTAEAAAIPVPKLKNVSRLRTEHQVYELPDSHPLVQGLDRREPDDPIPYLLAIWTPGELADSIEPPEKRCTSQENGELCKDQTCFSCNSAREANSQIVRGTLLIPCRTAMKGSFPLNGTYFQVNEVFADHESSLNPINVPRAGIWNLPRRTVYFGTSVPTIFRGLRTEEIQQCFWRGYVCVRGFDRKTRAPRPLKARLHFAASKLKARNANYK